MKPLQGRRILVTRPAAQADALAALIAEQGGEPLLFPLIAISPADDPTPLQQAIAQLDAYRLAVFISPNAALFSVPHILAERPWPPELRAAAVGPGTASQLAVLGIAPVIVPASRYDSAGLLERAELQTERVAGQRVLILRGNGGREELADTLRQRGALVDAITVYHRSPPEGGRELWAQRCTPMPDVLTISSSEALRNLVAMLDPEMLNALRRLPVFVPHPRIAEVATELGWQEVVLSRATDAGIIEALCDHPWDKAQ